MKRVTEQVYFSPEPGPLIVKAIARQFSHVLSVHDKETKYPVCFDKQKVKFLHLPMTDEGDIIDNAETAADYIHSIVDIVDSDSVDSKEDSKDLKGNKILVHCKVGINRSPFVILFYLTKYVNPNVKENLSLLIDLGTEFIYQPSLD